MGRKTLAIVIVLVVFGWTFLSVKSAVQHGLLSGWTSGPEQLKVRQAVLDTSDGTVLVVEWNLTEKPLEKLVDGRDAVFLFYPVMVYLPDEGHALTQGIPRVNLTVYPSERRVNQNGIDYTYWYYDTPGFALPKVGMVRAVYPLPQNVTGGRIELLLDALNDSRCSVVPVVFAYFHGTGGDEIEPDHLDLRLPLRLGPDFPLFGNSTLEVLLDFNASHWVEMHLGERGGWVRVETFNVTLPCQGG
ncbi:hypothetical protein [Thermococcus sp. ES12]|uniref:hypothetical protein n=1 Tax=Thermococcus sp. ES12 TaxID=1638246 RepID=UPI001430FADF|nr:hypothetical protein [Thermococcus sp. ES12]NJE75418.1 hypothetical protein [Thermococcus sp. ES12]